MPVRPALPAFIVLAFAMTEARAETFESVTFTPPPGWSAQKDATGQGYFRKDAMGTGAVFLFPGRPATGAPAAAFAEEWRARVAPLASVPAPQPTLQTKGDFTVAMGAAQGQPGAIVLVTLVGRGRAQSVLGVAGTEEILKQVSAFFDSVDVAGAPPAGPAAAQPGLELEFDPPPGYVAQLDAGGVTLKPKTPSRDAPCTYGILAPRPSRASFEADADAALSDLLPGWGKRYSGENEHRNKVKRGTGATGWPFYSYRADMQKVGQAGPLSLMVMVVPAGPKRVSVVWGGGDVLCTADDLGFVRLFHSLRPRGWTSDGGKALSQALVGSWTMHSGNALGVYVFRADGSFDDGSQATHTSGDVETTTSRAAAGGSWTLRGNELSLTTGKSTRSYRIRIVDERDVIWMRSLYLLNETAVPPYEVHYARQNWTPPSP